MNPNVVHYKRNIFKDIFKTSQRKTYTTLGVTIILVVLLSLVAIRPTIIKIGEIQSDIKAKEKLKIELEDKLKTLTILDQKYRDYEQIIPLLDQAIPAKSDTASLTANISELIKSYGMTLNSIQFADSVVSTGTNANQGIGNLSIKDDLGLTKISLTIDGTYEGIKSFIKALESYPRPMHIARFSLASNMSSSGSKSGNKTSNSSTVSDNVSINMEVYTLQKATTK
ncbi:MAG: hypothetical protein WCO33_04685 [bacterium]